MTLSTPLWMQNATYTGSDDRSLFAALMSAGVTDTSSLKVSQRHAGANMSVDVAAGHGVVTGTDTAKQGNYLCVSDATTNVALAASPASGKSRVDLIYAQVRDSSVTGTNDDWVVSAVTGVASTGTPVVPTLPQSALLLAQVKVSALVSSVVNANIIDKRVLSGSPLMHGDTSIPPSFDGQMITAGVGIWTGLAGYWFPASRIAKFGSTGINSRSFSGSVWTDAAPTVTLPAPGWAVNAVAQWTGSLNGGTTIVRTSIREGTGAWSDGVGVTTNGISGSPHTASAATSATTCAGNQTVTAKLSVYATTGSTIDPSFLTLTLYPA